MQYISGYIWLPKVTFSFVVSQLNIIIVPFDIPAIIRSPSLLIVIAVTLESGGICHIAFGIDKVAID